MYFLLTDQYGFKNAINTFNVFRSYHNCVQNFDWKTTQKEINSNTKSYMFMLIKVTELKLND
jgi:hypothetical protein